MRGLHAGALDVAQQQGSSLVGGETAGKADGQSVRVEYFIGGLKRVTRGVVPRAVLAAPAVIENAPHRLTAAGAELLEEARVLDREHRVLHHLGDLADRREVAPLLAERGHRSVPGHEAHVVATAGGGGRAKA